MLDFILKVLSITLSLFIIYVIVTIVWQQAEVMIYGEITPRVVDDVVAIILTVSLYFNIEFLASVFT